MWITQNTWFIEITFNAADSCDYRHCIANNTCLTPKLEPVGHSMNGKGTNMYPTRWSLWWCITAAIFALLGPLFNYLFVLNIILGYITMIQAIVYVLCVRVLVPVLSSVCVCGGGGRGRGVMYEHVYQEVDLLEMMPCFADRGYLNVPRSYTSIISYRHLTSRKEAGFMCLKIFVTTIIMKLHQDNPITDNCTGSCLVKSLANRVTSDRKSSFTVANVLFYCFISYTLLFHVTKHTFTLKRVCVSVVVGCRGGGGGGGGEYGS